MTAQWKQWRRISQVYQSKWISAMSESYITCMKDVASYWACTHTPTTDTNINDALCCLPHLLHINAYVVTSRMQTADHSGRNWSFSLHPPDFVAVSRVSIIRGVDYNIITTTYLFTPYLFFFIMFESLFTFLPRKFYFCQIIRETKVSWL